MRDTNWGKMFIFGIFKVFFLDANFCLKFEASEKISIRKTSAKGSLFSFSFNSFEESNLFSLNSILGIYFIEKFLKSEKR